MTPTTPQKVVGILRSKGFQAYVNTRREYIEGYRVSKYGRHVAVSSWYEDRHKATEMKDACEGAGLKTAWASGNPKTGCFFCYGE